MSVAEILKGNIQAAARLMRDIENNVASARSEVIKLVPHTGHAHIVGVTGPPGTGKSALLDRMIGALRERGQTVGVVVIDPTSPFSGGAILGDRLRMQRHTTDPGVFIRSLATRGGFGGLSPATYDTVTVLDAMGKDIILIETVGTGQDETAVSRLAHTNIVVSIPGMGDGVQAIKAGILESGDIFVVNKADRPDADLAAGELEAMLNMRTYPQGAWKPPVVLTAPLHDQGVTALLDEIDRHREYLGEYLWEAHHEKQIENRFLEILRDLLFREAKSIMQQRNRWDLILESVKRQQTDPHTAAESVIAEVLQPPE